MGTSWILLRAEDAARQDAKDAIRYARSSGTDPIEWITGNSHMPPLRAFGRADQFYSGSFWNPSDAWIVYAETFEAELDKANVYLGCPDYDNALFVVDMDRFEFVDESELDESADSLSNEWRLITKEPN